MIIQHNMSAINGINQLGKLSVRQTKSNEKLSSGYRINRAADDAAGLGISEKLRIQIRGLRKASMNSQDGISYIQVAEGALGEVHSLLQRAKELAVQGANDTNTFEDRSAIQEELNALKTEIDRITDDTEYNTMNVFSRNGASPHMFTSNQVTAPYGINMNVSYTFVDSNGNVSPVSSSQATGSATSYAGSDMAEFVKKAAANAVYKISGAYPGMMAAASSSLINIGLEFTNVDGSGNTLAVASLSMGSNATSTSMAYTLKVDTSDYPIATFSSMTDAQKSDLAAVIAHEMTHLIMYDTTTDGMLNGKTTTLPLWFVEGMAQTSSGDNGWVSYQINPGSSDNVIKNYMSALTGMPYGAGYLATMYLGQAASGQSTVNSANIKSGLDTILTDLANKKSFDDAIKDNTGFTGMSDFVQKFTGGDADALKFVKDLLNARGTGAGSLLAGDLSTLEADAFAPSALSDSASNYVVKDDNTKYTNYFGTGYTPPQPGSGGGGGNPTPQNDSGEGLHLQVGALREQGIYMERFNVSSDELFLGNSYDVSSYYLAGLTISTVDAAIDKVSSVRSYYGALQNRLEHTLANLDNTVENSQAAESRIRDTDMAAEMVENSRFNILTQVAESILAQSNHSKGKVVELISGQ